MCRSIAIVGKAQRGQDPLGERSVGQGAEHRDAHRRHHARSDQHPFNVFGFDVVLLDTAGIRKKSKVDEDIEFYSVLRSVRAIEESDVCLLLIDAQDGIQHQDLHIFSMIEKNGKGVVVW
jgi:GTP-binding protein